MNATTDMINTSFRTSKTLKRHAYALFRSLGMNTSTALNIFMAQAVRDQALPFTPSRTKTPTPELLDALRESNDITSGKLAAKKYNSFNDLLADLDND